MHLELDHVVLRVSDMDRSCAFYAAVVGAEVLELNYGRHGLRIGDRQLNVHGPGSQPEPVAAKPAQPGGFDACFVWPGPIDGAVDHLAEPGVQIELGPVPRTGALGPGTSVYFRDPDGSVLELMSYDAP